MTQPAENSGENSSPARKPPPGRPFEKGKSGNPGGRPKGLARAVRDVPAALGLTEPGEVILARFWWRIVSDEKWDPAQRIQASKLLAERGWGKPAEYVPIEETDPLGFSEEQTRQMAAELDDQLDELAERRAARG